MVEALLRPRRRRAKVAALSAAAVRYAKLGWPVCTGARLRDQAQHGAGGRACSCDRIGCPAPGAHPLSPAWQRETSDDPAVVREWWQARPAASVLLVTGRAFDVLDVPAAAGSVALTALQHSGVRPGPVALSVQDRMLFFVTSRAALAEDDEWWSCHLDCEPETLPAVSGLRWHCLNSYVLAPPSRIAGGTAARWLVPPGAAALPDSLRLLEFLADACEEIGQ
jgi:Bifunctional DNA primase/polymerase, N-terminal